MIEKLIEHINNITPLTAAEVEVVRDLFKEKVIPRKSFLLRTGDYATFSAFVLEGCLRSYAIDKNGYEHILQFAPENWWIADMQSAIKLIPTELNIDALLDTKVLLLSRNSQLHLFDQVPKLERYFRILTENALAASNQRTIDLLTLPAKQRYLKFCQLYPTIVHTIPLKAIASYIGITPEFLSKLRAEGN